MSLVCCLGDQTRKVTSAKSATSGGKRSPTGGSACHNVCVSTKFIVYMKVHISMFYTLTILSHYDKEMLHEKP